MAKPEQNLPLRKISDFKSKLVGGGARPNLFEVVLTFPDTLIIPQDTLDNGRFLVKGAALPSSTINPIEIPFRGRMLKIAGDRTFDTWTITVLNDTTFALRSAFEQWMDYINHLEDGTGTTNPTDYQRSAVVHQLDRTGKVLRSYNFVDIFPTNMSTIDLNYETTDAIEEFTVEMQVHYWEAYQGTDNPGGENVPSPATA